MLKLFTYVLLKKQIEMWYKISFYFSSCDVMFGC